MNNLINATLVWDGSGDPIIPAQLLPSGGMEQIASAGQFVGTSHEKLCEIAGRSCYDSFGKGRTSDGFHKHILEVGHLSVLEHAVLTVDFALRRPEQATELAAHFLNRPSLFVVQSAPYTLQVTLNLRHVLEWEQQTTTSLITDYEESKALGVGLRSLAGGLAPQIVPGMRCDVWFMENQGVQLKINSNPFLDTQRWVSLLLSGSRGFSHEQVRHGDWSAISQRSTRYVDESDGDWVEHPLITQYLSSGADKPHRAPNGELTELAFAVRARDSAMTAKRTYREAVARLEPWLASKGVDKLTARKQARGAARGYLGNALYTEMIFSASVAQWKRMLRQRLHPAADAEIREVYACVLGELRKSRYRESFEAMQTVPSPDGIGIVLAEQG